MNPYIDWRINNAITKSRILTGVLRSSEFISGITCPLIKIADDMLEWFSGHKKYMSYDAQVSYLVEVAKIQADIEFYQGINKNLWEEDCT